MGIVNDGSDARFAVLVLPYEMSALAIEKELIVDYATGHIYVKSIDGKTEISITKKLEQWKDLLESEILTGDLSKRQTVNVSGITADKLNPALNELKQYVDAMQQGLTPKGNARALADTNITPLSGLKTIDGVSLIAGDKVLLTGQTTKSENGKWVINAGAWIRSDDFDETADVKNGAFIFIAEGTKYSDSGWVLTTNTPITIGTTLLDFQQFTGSGQIVAGIGITKEGNELRLSPTGITAGSYTKFNTDIYGRVISASNPTTLLGFGITDAAPLNHVGSNGNTHNLATAVLAGFLSPNHFNRIANMQNIIDTSVNVVAEKTATKVGGVAVDLNTFKPGNIPPGVVVENTFGTSVTNALAVSKGKELNDRMNSSIKNQNTANPVDIKHWIGTQIEYNNIPDANIDRNTLYTIIN